MDTIGGCLAGELKLTMEKVELLSRNPVERRKTVVGLPGYVLSGRHLSLGKAGGRWDFYFTTASKRKKGRWRG